ncbi:MAG: alpha-galactosidase [Candidatus Borkfalkiaceae bacterium]|nr:alpha-galactosidase [Christensenellaceae bacterium]
MELHFQNFQGIRLEENRPPEAEIATAVRETDKGYVFIRKIRNFSDRTVSLKELSVRLSGVSFGGDGADDYFYCNENNRIYGTMTLPVDYDRSDPSSPRNGRYSVSVDTGWADPGTVGGRICASPYQPFPAVLFGNYSCSRGVVIGSLSQEVFYHSFGAGHDGNGLYIDIFSSFKGIACREMRPGEELTDAFCILETDCADDVNRLFEGYVRLLREVLKDNRGRGGANRHSLIWGSWNDGIYRNVSEEMLVAEAKAVKTLFPNAEWFQLDDGYSALCDQNPDLAAHGLGVAYEGEDGVDRKKFPDGLKGYADKIRAVGLRPSLWIGGLCPVQSRIYREHPEWFVDYTYRVDFSQPLDVSIPEVREYMTDALDELVVKPGFEGVKLDFWSYVFEDGRDLLRNKDKSGYEYREWWHGQLRSRLPSDGYLQTGCDVCAGNPFLGKYFNNYRFGLDVGAGRWENVLTTVFWGMAVLPTHTGDLFIPNSDSIGLLPGLDDADFEFVVNYQIVTRSIVEISGRFSREDIDEKRLGMIRRATKYVNNGENVFFPRYDYRKTGRNLPEIAYIDSAFDRPEADGVKTVALFNAGETEKAVRFGVSDIGFSGEVEFTDVWRGGTVRAEEYSCVLPPHGSRLLYAEKKELKR